MFSPTTFRLVFQGTQKSVDIVRQAIGEHGQMFTYSETEPFCGELKRRLLQRAPCGPGFRGLVSGAPAADSRGKESREPCLSRADRAAAQSWESGKK